MKYKLALHLHVIWKWKVNSNIVEHWRGCLRDSVNWITNIIKNRFRTPYVKQPPIF